MKRNTRGVGFTEIIVSIPLLGLTSATCLSLYLMFVGESISTAEARYSTESLNHIKMTLSPALDGMHFKKYNPATFENNGPINGSFNFESTNSARWLWIIDKAAAYQLFPHVFSLMNKSGICLQDRITRIEFNRELKELSFSHQYRGEGALVECLGGNEPRIQIERFTWNGVSEAQLISLGNRSIRFWFQLNGEWHSIDAGFVEL
ncbi:hypothetical protein [Gloeobacter morelensis]|uniref:Pilus assembly protein n=1 Tax=Gloeobacter morelensis MG652769 TaxID=2781736 RepID=A0ABY3PNV8_9CYAN|nr:hypothetical protein [Gloeobacter morelensis]UFP95371.1 hypothetical protein ISF26_03735 [Gloeobacter morelensis MG652769]